VRTINEGNTARRIDDEEDDEFIQSLERLNQLMENLTPSQRENIPELAALFTLFCIKEDSLSKF
jgi:hypothetical protein